MYVHVRIYVSSLTVSKILPGTDSFDNDILPFFSDFSIIFPPETCYEMATVDSDQQTIQCFSSDFRRRSGAGGGEAREWR